MLIKLLLIQLSNWKFNEQSELYSTEMTFSIVFNRLYFTEMTFRIVCKRNDIQKCISRKWHSVIVFNRWYFMEMTFRIVFKRNDIQNCISPKWHSVLYWTGCISRKWHSELYFTKMTFRSGLWNETEIPEYFNLFVSHILLNSMKKVKLEFSN